MNVWHAFLGSFVRWALTALFGGLVVRGVIDEQMLNRITSEGAVQVTAGIIGLLVPLGWSWWQKIQAKVRVMIALNAPSDAGQKTVKEWAEAIPTVEKVTAALNDRHDLLERRKETREQP